MSEQSPQATWLRKNEGKRSPVVNDFSIQVATVNGSGSQSSNTVLMRSIFQMGIPVSGKNLFPSNIAGLPTWFTIRANKDGWIARRKEIDFLIAMNPETAREDVLSIDPNRVVVYEETLRLNQYGKTHILPGPFRKARTEITPDSRLRKLLANMIYVGVVGHLWTSIPHEMEIALTKQFKGKAKAVALNKTGARNRPQVRAKKISITSLVPYRCQRMNATQGKIIIDGNSAAALGCMFAGVTVATWYPITPSSSLCETLADYMKEYRIEKDGKATFAIVQAEDELAAVGMAIGAGWAGARSMTSTAGPGISLMQEFIGLGILRRNSGCDLRHHARRTQHRTSDANAAVGHPFDGLLLARRYQAHHADSGQRRRMFRDGDRSVRSGGTIPDPDLRHERSRSRHEQLDVGSVQVPDEEIRSRQSARRLKICRELGELRAIRGRGRRRNSVIARCPERSIRSPRISLAAAATTRKPTTASGRTTTSATWTA